ncbi:MAG: hypothetical protein AB7S39_01255 [Gemmatimonadales bacterium]
MLAVALAACGGSAPSVAPEPRALGPDRFLQVPPRPPGVPGGADLGRQLDSLDLAGREERVFLEVARGNVPSWLRRLVPVELAGRVAGRERRVVFWVTPDYLAVGADADYLLQPLSPQAAQRIADLVAASLPTPAMVDAIWAAARVRLDPAPIPPSPRMTTEAVFVDHNEMVAAARRRSPEPLGALVAGDKKDVVLVPALAESPGRVAIYGWHRLTGDPIQPVYLGHTDRWVDYSHGIRLVSRRMLVDGAERDLREVLRDPDLAPLLTRGGPIAAPAYPVRPD